VAWETRRGRGAYYTRTRRRDGRRVREYIGGGQTGALAAAEDAHRRAERRASAEARRQEQDRLRITDEPLRRLEALVRLVTQAALVAAGFVQHDRGEWRHRKHDASYAESGEHGRAG
jgi:hypothetical protein